HEHPPVVQLHDAGRLPDDIGVEARRLGDGGIAGRTRGVAGVGRVAGVLARVRPRAGAAAAVVVDRVWVGVAGAGLAAAAARQEQRETQGAERRVGATGGERGHGSLRTAVHPTGGRLARSTRGPTGAPPGAPMRPALLLLLAACTPPDPEV